MGGKTKEKDKEKRGEGLLLLIVVGGCAVVNIYIHIYVCERFFREENGEGNGEGNEMRVYVSG